MVEYTAVITVLCEAAGQIDFCGTEPERLIARDMEFLTINPPDCFRIVFLPQICKGTDVCTNRKIFLTLEGIIC